MNIKPIRRLLLVICAIIVSNIIMGMMVKTAKQSPLSQEYEEILKRLPKTGPNIARLNQSLDIINAILKQDSPNLSLVRDMIQKKVEVLKKYQFSTEYGVLTGEQLMNLYFANFINSLNNALQMQVFQPLAIEPKQKIEPKTPTTEISSIQTLRKHFDQILKNIGESGQNIQTVRKYLVQVQNLLNKPEPELEKVLTGLEAIRNSALKNLQFSTSTLGPEPISGQQFFEIYLHDFIRMLKMEIQSTQLHASGTPHGLKNKGNACFMNSSVQALASLDQMTNLLLKHTFNDFYNSNSLAALYIKLLHEMQTEKQAIIDPLPFCLLGWKSIPGSAEGQQEDAGEFVQHLLQSLIENDINTQRVPAGRNLELLSLLEIKTAQRTFGKSDIPLVSRDENFLMLPLAINETNKTLLDCLQSHFKIGAHPDPLQTDKSVLNALTDISNYFLIRLHRTAYSRLLQRIAKNEIPISFELDNFNISSLSLTSKQFPLYRLKSIVVHIGPAGGGHYIAYVRKGEQWYLCDDTTIVPVALEEMQRFAKSGVMISAFQDKLLPVLFFYEQQK